MFIFDYILSSSYYDEYLICRKMNGACTDDYNWIRFDYKKELKYEDVKMRA